MRFIRQSRKKIAEAQTELAFVYWRTGENDNARACIKEALALLSVDSDLSESSDPTCCRGIQSGTSRESTAHPQKAWATIRQDPKSHAQGSYHDTLGNALEDLSVLKKRRNYDDRALIEYAAARYHFEQAQHRCYLAAVENNLGMRRSRK